MPSDLTHIESAKDDQNRAAGYNILRSPGPIQGRPNYHILSISPTNADHETLRGMLAHFSSEISTASCCREALLQLNREPVAIIFCEARLGDGAWKDVLNSIRVEEHPPLLIVTSRLADERLWAEVINLGGFDVLAKPFNAKEVHHVMMNASLWLETPAVRVRAAAAM